MTDLVNQSLFRIPSVSKGAARIVSIFGKLDEYQLSDSEQEADSDALSGDWKAVGKDMSNALKEYGKDLKK